MKYRNGDYTGPNDDCHTLSTNLLLFSSRLGLDLEFESENVAVDHSHDPIHANKVF